MFVPIFNLFICYLFTLLIQLITSATPCIYDLPNGKKLDIRTLGNSNGKTPKYDNIPNSNPTPVTFSWNGCFDYSKSDGGSCTNAAGCTTNRNTGQSAIIAKQTEVEFEPHSDTMNILVYHHNDILLQVILTCVDSDTDVAKGRQDDSNIFDIEIQSRCCCPGKCQYSDGSIGGGAVFVIILVVVIFVYIVGGMAFLRFGRHATGPDMIPNRLMWLSILSYATDGLRYCIQVIRHTSFSVDYQKI